jgi:DHA2 family multidrug resistance protein
VFIFPLFVQISLGWTATQTGLFMIPGALFTAFTMPTIGMLLGKGVNPKRIIIIGAIMTFFFLYILSFASPDSSESNFYFPFILRGIGMACMMSPILSLAISGLQGKDMAQAVGLSNMIRQLGGSVGIALINVFLVNKNAEVRGNMLSYVTDYSQQTQERIMGIKQSFLMKGYSLQEAETLANKSLEGIIFKQQALLSYVQGFYVVGISILLIIPVVLLIRYKKPSGGAKVVDAH